MGLSRREVYYWLETASDSQLLEMLESSKQMLSLLTDGEQVSTLKWLRTKIIEELDARKEVKSI